VADQMIEGRKGHVRIVLTIKATGEKSHYEFASATCTGVRQVMALGQQVSVAFDTDIERWDSGWRRAAG
jgi:hypothetical protein